MDEEWFRDWISRGNWVFAKTMPTTPHWYVVRKEQQDQREFDRVVLAIRKHGWTIKFQGSPYVIWVQDGYKYWTMGWPVHSSTCRGNGVGADCHKTNCTFIINRAIYPYGPDATAREQSDPGPQVTFDAPPPVIAEAAPPVPPRPPRMGVV